MTVPRCRLNHLKKSLQELSQFGSPVDLEVAEQDPHSDGLEIEQIGESLFFELANGRSGCMLDVSVTNQTSRPAYILDKEIDLPWDEDWLQWLEPHVGKARNFKERTHFEYKHYKFPGFFGWDLPFDQVINHKLTSGRTLSPRRPISGCLLAMGGLMPPHLFHGGQLEATLVITTSDHVEHAAPIVFCTERLGRKPKQVRCRPSLFSDPVEDQKPGVNNNAMVAIRDPETTTRKEVKVRLK